MKRIIVVLAMVVVYMGLCTGCSKKATDMYLNQNTAEIALDEEIQLKYTLFPEESTVKEIKWQSINTDVATVDDTGLVKPVAEGTTTIICSTSSGLKATCEVTVKKPSAIKLLNSKEFGLFNYMVSEMLTSFYDASAARLRNIYGDMNATDSIYTIELQGNNRLGGTVFKHYIIMIGTDGKYSYLDMSDYWTGDADPVDRNVMDYAKINAALEEYWSNNSVN